MKPFLNILVGVNYTESSRHALVEAKRIADENGAKITACHVVPIGDLTEFVDFYFIEHKIMLNAAQSSLEGFADEVLGKNHDIICRISEGIPHHELVSKANEEGHDLLILGDESHNENAAQFVIKCLRFATMPVLLVNPPLNTPGPVAACIDFSKSTAAIFENIARMNFEPISSLDVIHSSRPPWLRPLRLRYRAEIHKDSGIKDEFREILHGRLAVACEQASSVIAAQVAPVLLEDEDPTEALVQHLEKSNYRLVVIGRAGKGFKSLVSDLLGGTAESVVRQAKTNVLIVPIQD